MTASTTPIGNEATRDKILNTMPSVFTKLNSIEQAISLELYRKLAEATPVEYADLAKSLDMFVVDIEDIVGQWPGVYHDEQNRIIGYWGLGLSEMPHRMKIANNTLFAWCAWDSLFIPQLINKTTQVYSRCEVSKQDIVISITSFGIEKISPSTAVMSFVATDGAQIEDDIIGQFCHYVLFFHSAEIGSTWVEQNPGSFLMTVEDGFALGQRKNYRQYPDLLT